MTLTPVSIIGLPGLAWRGEPAAHDFDAEAQRLSITARAGTDWSNDPLTGQRTANAAALLFVPEDDFALSASVSVDFAGTFDAGALCLWQSQAQWAKLCFEHSPQGEAMVVSVVTRDISDDANALVIEGSSVHLRLLRIGHAYAFHYSLDGSVWHFVRLFRLGQGGEPMHAGFLAQAPDTSECTSTFESISFSTEVPADLRNGA